jgi:hypothetical protein
MKKLLLCLFILSQITSFAFSATQSDTTDGFKNGYFWNSSSEIMRLGFVVGFSEAASATQLIVGISEVFATETEGAKSAEHIDERPLSKIIAEGYAWNGTFGDLCDYLNTFYSAPQNRVIPIHIVITYYASLSKGIVTKADIDAAIKTQLKFYADNPPIESK